MRLENRMPELEHQNYCQCKWDELPWKFCAPSVRVKLGAQPKYQHWRDKNCNMDHLLGVTLQASGREGRAQQSLCWHCSIQQFWLSPFCNYWTLNCNITQDVSLKWQSHLTSLSCVYLNVLCELRPLTGNVYKNKTRKHCAQTANLKRGKEQEQHCLNCAALTVTIHKILNETWLIF